MSCGPPPPPPGGGGGGVWGGRGEHPPPPRGGGGGVHFGRKWRKPPPHTAAIRQSQHHRARRPHQAMRGFSVLCSTCEGLPAHGVLLMDRPLVVRACLVLGPLAPQAAPDVIFFRFRSSLITPTGTAGARSSGPQWASPGRASPRILVLLNWAAKLVVLFMVLFFRCANEAHLASAGGVGWVVSSPG